MRPTKRGFFTASAVSMTLLMALAADARAQSSTESSEATSAQSAASLAPDRYFIQYSGGEGNRAQTIGLEWDWAHSRRRSAPTDRIIYWELGVGRWETEFPAGARSRSVTQFTVAAGVRIDLAKLPIYVDGGIGPSWITPLFHGHNKTFSTKFNFRSHLSLGYELPGNAREVSVRVEHFSNAGIRHPNPGVNFWSIRYTHGL
jgi:lipid A 3-O-deacylase